MDSEATFEASLEEGWDSQLEKYLWDIFGCHVSPTQKRKLYRGVGSMDRETGAPIWYDSPVVLFEGDLDFQRYTASRVKWAFDTSKGWTNRRILTKSVNAICRYNTPRFGWPDHKEVLNGQEAVRTDQPGFAREERDPGTDEYAAQLTGLTYSGARSTTEPRDKT